MTRVINMNKYDTYRYLYKNSKVLIAPDGRVITPEDVLLMDNKKFNIEVA